MTDSAGLKRIVVSGSFDDLRAEGIRFLYEAARYGSVHVVLWSDDMVKRTTGSQPKCPALERRYLLESLRYVEDVFVTEEIFEPDALPADLPFSPDLWVFPTEEHIINGKAHVTSRQSYCVRQLYCVRQSYCAPRGIASKMLGVSDLAGYIEPDAFGAANDVSIKGGGYAKIADVTLPAARYRGLSTGCGKSIPTVDAKAPRRKKVVVTGCFDWFHSGHVRFFEEVSTMGDLYVVVGHDANIRLLKGEGHPFFPEQVRRFVVQSVRFVKQALVSSGDGWLDAEPEIERIQPDLYVVNEDGDKPEKREFCARKGIEYVILKRSPREGLPRRSSTDLRGF